MPLPTASFIYSYLTNQHINFDASSSEGSVTSYKWDFGDGINSTGRIVDDTYLAEGDYAVTLNVQNDNGGIDSKTRNIRIDLPLPTTIANISNILDNKNEYPSNVQITLTATDNINGSGVNKTEYSFDNANWSIYNSTFNKSIEGFPTLYYHSIDNAGNIEQIKTLILER